MPKHPSGACHADTLQKNHRLPGSYVTPRAKIIEMARWGLRPSGAIRPTQGESTGANRPTARSRLERIAPLHGLGWSESPHPPATPQGAIFGRRVAREGGRRGQAVAVFAPRRLRAADVAGYLLAREPSCIAADSLWIMQQARFGELRRPYFPSFRISCRQSRLRNSRHGMISIPSSV